VAVGPTFEERAAVDVALDELEASGGVVVDAEAGDRSRIELAALLSLGPTRDDTKTKGGR
jgi:hypothetical protein